MFGGFMNLDEIKAKADTFFEFPIANRDHVTTTSAILFARHILEYADCSANCHQFHDSIVDAQKIVAERCREIAVAQMLAPPGAWGKGATFNAEKIAGLIKEEFGLGL